MNQLHLDDILAACPANVIVFEIYISVFERSEICGILSVLRRMFPL
jgi:hypothetical protein